MKIYQFGEDGYIIIGKSLKKDNIDGVDDSVLEDICKEIGSGEEAVFLTDKVVYDFLLHEGGVGRDLLLNVVGSIISRGVLKPEEIHHYISLEETKKNNEFIRNMVNEAYQDLGLDKKDTSLTKKVNSKIIK